MWRVLIVVLAVIVARKTPTWSKIICLSGPMRKALFQNVVLFWYKLFCQYLVCSVATLWKKTEISIRTDITVDQCTNMTGIKKTKMDLFCFYPHSLKFSCHFLVREKSIFISITVISHQFMLGLSYFCQSVDMFSKWMAVASKFHGFNLWKLLFYCSMNILSRIYGNRISSSFKRKHKPEVRSIDLTLNTYALHCKLSFLV